MKDLKCRKQLLIAESELNRAELICDWQSIRGEVHALSNRAETICTMVKAAAMLVSGISSLRGNKSPPAAEKSSWWQAILKGAGWVGSFWSDFRAKDRLN